MRRISRSLPTFNTDIHDKYAEKEKLGRGRWNFPLLRRVGNALARTSRKTRIRALIVAVLLLCYTLFYVTRKFPAP